ncbi:hypothetical protein [Aquihabitans sp. McL0605]|uniref:hypothetical protein n=1 Tax=Aquihabitans sp. McL0605 TaxID=3415671 RepID=UPI003CEA9FEC
MSAPRSRRPAREGEQGTVLLLVLVFMIVFGVLIAGVLDLVTVNLKTTVIVRSRTERTYAADAGIEQAIARLRIDPTACTTESPSALAPAIVNRRTATVSCQVAPGGDLPLGASGWAAIITGDLLQQAGGTAGLNGPLYVQGAISGSFKNTEGSVYQHGATCPGSMTKPSGLTVTPSPPYSWQCTTAPPPDPPHVLPPVPAAPKAADTYGSCRVFYPGTYTAAPDLLGENYFVSGVYYFQNIGSWQVPVGRTVTGGSNPSDVSPLTTPCRANADAMPGGGGTGFGVEWIFGGSSNLSFKNNDEFELHSRVPGPAETGVTPRVSFVGVPATAGGYLRSTPPDTVFDTSGGSPAVAIHGLFYAPNADADLDGPNGLSVFRGGAVIHDAHLKLSGTSDGSVPIFTVGTSATDKRYVVITATATSPGEGDVTARALVELRKPGSTQLVIVRSWRTQ